MSIEEIKRHRSTWKGYRAHLTRLITNADELMDSSAEELTEENRVKIVASLDSLLKQLDRKEKLLADLDAKILPLINDEGEIETEVFETEEIQAKIAETVGRIKVFCSTPLQTSKH